MLSNRKGFTLIELLIVVVIIGILAAIAIPKFAATKDKAKLSAVKTDLRNIMTAQEGYFSDYNSYTSSFAQLNFQPSAGNTGSMTGVASGYTASLNNTSISAGVTTCQVQVGANASSTIDGIIRCP